MDRLIHSIRKLKNNISTHIPNHGWTEVFDREVKPRKIIIVEGYLLFVNKELANLFDKKMWVEVSDINLLRRRTKRYSGHGGNDYTEKIGYIVNVVIPESKKYEKLQRERADVIVNGNNSKEQIRKDVERHMRQ